MKNLKVYDLSKFSKQVAEQIAAMKGVNIAGDFLYVDKFNAKLIERIIKNRKAKTDEEEKMQKDIYNSVPSGRIETVDYSKKFNKNF